MKESLRDKLNREWREFVEWARKSWTVWFNTLAALVAIFADNLSALSGVASVKMYAALSIIVPMVNYLLRMRTQKKIEPKSPPVLGGD